jgi:protein TonB
MTIAGYAPPPENRLPALAAAAALHVAAILAMLYWVHPTMLPVGSAVPINIVSSAPATDSRPAEEAPQVQTAATETPAPEAKPTPPPPPSPPKPTPTVPHPALKPPTPTPTPKPVQAQQKPTPTPTPKTFDWASIQNTIDRAARSAPPRPSAAPRGPTRAETDTHARVDAGQGVSQSQLEGLQQLLGRLWNPNCQVEGGDAVKLKVSFTVGPDGRLSGPVNAFGSQTSADTVVAAAARRAIDAVHQVEPFSEPYRNQKILVNFNAREVCASR